MRRLRPGGPFRATPPGAPSQAYRNSVLFYQPVAYWRLGELGGLTAKDELGLYHGTYTGAFTQGQPGSLGASGDSDTAVLFDGASGYVTAGDPAGLRLDYPLTIEAWVFVTDRANYYMIVTHSAAAASSYELRIDQTTGLLACQLNGGGTANSNTPVPLGQWNHVALTYDGANARFYLNGVPDGSPADPAGHLSTAAGSTFYVGRRDDGFFFKGSLDEVAVYAFVMSPAQVLAHYQVANGASWATPVDNDSAGASEAIASIAAGDSETASGGDSVTFVGPSGADSGSGAEAAGISTGTTDSASGVETAGIVLGAADAASGTDTGGSVVLAGAEVGSGADTAGMTLAAAETGAGADAAGIAPTAVDAGAGVDSAQIATTASDASSGPGADVVASIAPGAAETGVGADTASVAATVTDSDSGLGGDLASVALDATDTASAVDAPTALAAGAADSGSAAEIGAVALAGDDGGQGAQTATIQTSGTDLGLGSESTSIQASVADSDTAVSDDAGSLLQFPTSLDAAGAVDLGQASPAVSSADAATADETGIPTAASPDSAAASEDAGLSVASAESAGVTADQARVLGDADTGAAGDSGVPTPINLDSASGAELVASLGLTHADSGVTIERFLSRLVDVDLAAGTDGGAVQESLIFPTGPSGHVDEGSAGHGFDSAGGHGNDGTGGQGQPGFSGHRPRASTT